MSERSEQQYDEIIKKLNELLEQNKVLAQQNAQKDDEIALLKEQNNYLMRKLFGSKKETIMDPNQGSLFDDQLFSQPEQTGEQSDEEVIIEKYTRRKKKKRSKRRTIKTSTNGRSYS